MFGARVPRAKSSIVPDKDARDKILDSLFGDNSESEDEEGYEDEDGNIIPKSKALDEGWVNEEDFDDCEDIEEPKFIKIKIRPRKSLKEQLLDKIRKAKKC
jgi:hypothetical protein